MEGIARQYLFFMFSQPGIHHFNFSFLSFDNVGGEFFDLRIFALFQFDLRHINGALMMREMVTRYGREGLGFLWVVGEPLMFCLGVIVMWTFLKPAYEHGVRVGPFVMTGYMCLLLLRHHHPRMIKTGQTLCSACH